MISSRSWYHRNTFHSNIMNLYRDHPASTSLGKEEGVDEEMHKKWRRKEDVRWKKWCLSHKFLYVSHKFLYVLFPVTQSLFLLGFSSSPGNITASIKTSTSKKVPISIPEITQIFAQKYYNSTTLSIWVVYTKCVSTNSIASEDVIFYLLYMKLLFSHSIVFYWSLVNNTGKVLE